MTTIESAKQTLNKMFASLDRQQIALDKSRETLTIAKRQMEELDRIGLAIEES